MPLLASLAGAMLLAAIAAADSSQRRVTEPRLLRIDSLITGGLVATARDSLSAWNTAHPRNDTTVNAADKAFALLLDGKLARDWAAAEQAFQTLALTYPVSPHAPEALLRLAQGLLVSASTARAGNTADRAASYLERLVTDYPTSPLRTTAFLWLARAYLLTDRTPLACNRLIAASAIVSDSVASNLVRELRQRACSQRAP